MSIKPQPWPEPAEEIARAVRAIYGGGASGRLRLRPVQRGREIILVKFAAKPCRPCPARPRADQGGRSDRSIPRSAASDESFSASSV
jgi:hypothetical protein